MTAVYRVQQGDYVSKIASKFGFNDYQPIWGDPKNAPLRQKRKNPNVLFPGDVLFIPDKREKTEARQTTVVHRFTVAPKTVMLRVVLRDWEGEPIPQTPCVLQVDNAVYNLTTDSTGQIEKPIPITAESAFLIFGEERIPVKIGYLDPVEEGSGQRARLNNLGYQAGTGTEGEDDLLRYAIEEFQCDQQLPVDGRCGPQTQAKLKEAHGC